MMNARKYIVLNAKGELYDFEKCRTETQQLEMLSLAKVELLKYPKQANSIKEETALKCVLKAIALIDTRLKGDCMEVLFLLWCLDTALDELKEKQGFKKPKGSIYKIKKLP